MKYFPNNTLTEYTTHLAKKIDLQDEWEFGLAEIQYPHAWYNITDSDEDHVSFSSDDGANWLNCRIESDLYLTVESLLEAIQQSAPTKSTKTRETYNLYTIVLFSRIKKMHRIICWFPTKTNPYAYPATPLTEPIKTTSVKTADVNDGVTDDVTGITKYRGGTVSICVKKHCLFRLSQKCIYVLGLNTEHAVFSRGLHKSVTDPNLDSITSLFVYSDICQYSLIGDVSAPLLRIVQVKNGERMVTKTFPHVYYTPVSKKNFGAVEIYIRDDTGVKYHSHTGSWW